MTAIFDSFFYYLKMQQFYYIISILIKYALSITQNEELRIKLYSLQDQANAIGKLAFQNLLIIQYLDTFSYIVKKYDNSILELMTDLIKYLKTFSSPVKHSAAEIAVLCLVYNDICPNTSSSFLEQIKAYLNPYYEFLLILKKEKKYLPSNNYKISDEKQILLAFKYLGPTAVEFPLAINKGR
jgi:hypothetical protein